MKPITDSERLDFLVETSAALRYDRLIWAWEIQWRTPRKSPNLRAAVAEDLRGVIDIAIKDHRA